MFANEPRAALLLLALNAAAEAAVFAPFPTSLSVCGGTKPSPNNRVTRREYPLDVFRLTLGSPTPPDGRQLEDEEKDDAISNNRGRS